MIVLLDTSTPVCRLILVNDTMRTEYEWDAGRQLSHGLLRFLIEKLADHGATLHDLAGIGVMRGPGSFTGLRIGLTVANTLADGLGIPIVGETIEYWPEQALSRVCGGHNDRIVLPEYGAEAHITLPRK